MTLCLKRLMRCKDGAAMVEFSIVVGLLLTVSFGLVEFGMAFYQWNSATKAAQLGVRLAAVSSPVAGDLTTLTGMEDGASPGQAFPFFERVCSSKDRSCRIGEGPVGDINCENNFCDAAMNRLIFGSDASCQTVAPGGVAGMCDVFPRIQEAEDVIVTYRHTELGFAGRPGGPVPTVSVELIGLPVDFVFLDALLILKGGKLPNVRITVTGEDLSTTVGS